MSDRLTRIDHHIAALEGVLAELRAEREAAAAEADVDMVDSGTAAMRLGVSKDTVRRLARNHAAGVRIGGRWRISMAKARARLS
jgi:excisionase family DNA binding protein